MRLQVDRWTRRFGNDGQQNLRCPSPHTWPPLLSLCRLTVSVFVCDIHLTVFDGLIFMIYFEYNETSDHDEEEEKEKRTTCKMGILCFHRYNYVDL